MNSARTRRARSASASQISTPSASWGAGSSTDGVAERAGDRGAARGERGLGARQRTELAEHAPAGREHGGLPLVEQRCLAPRRCREQPFQLALHGLDERDAAPLGGRASRSSASRGQWSRSQSARAPASPVTAAASSSASKRSTKIVCVTTPGTRSQRTRSKASPSSRAARSSAINPPPSALSPKGSRRAATWGTPRTSSAVAISAVTLPGPRVTTAMSRGRAARGDQRGDLGRHEVGLGPLVAAGQQPDASPGSSLAGGSSNSERSRWCSAGVS